jgi:hypothetical protein
MELRTHRRVLTTTVSTRGENLMQDTLETMQAELDEGAALLRPYYGGDDESLRLWAIHWRPWRYEKGCWPSAEEIEAEKAKAKKLEPETV